MDVSHPIRVITPTLDAPVLEVLARTTQPLTGREVFRLARGGSDRGVRLVLRRLVRQGVVLADEHAGSTLYVANRLHLAWPAIEALVGLRASFLDQLRAQLRGWSIEPVHASLFGSAARGDGDAESDIDLLLVHSDGTDEGRWGAQLEGLRDWVVTGTGNAPLVFDVTRSRFAEYVAAADPLVTEWRRDGIHLGGLPIETLIRSSRRKPA